MKKITLLLVSFALILLSYNAFSQQSYGGLPVSYTNKSLSQDVDHIVLPQPDMDKIMLEDTHDEKNGQMQRIGRIISVDLNTETAGTWEVLSDGTEVWRLKISCRSAMSLTLLYSHFYLPEGTQLFLYNENRSQLLGAYDNRTNPTISNAFSTQMIQGESTYLELIKPANVTETPILNINGVIYNYRNVENFVNRFKDSKDTGWGTSEPCEVNVNCPEGANWQTEKRGVAEIFVITSEGAFFCSGTLVNNTSEDGTPYFLTADHCGGDAGNTYFAQWQFYFHYEASGCTTPSTEPTYQPITGSVFRSRGPVDGGTDFLLLELQTTEANIATINGYYNGWDKTTTASTAGVCIHHPSGDIKKISTYTAALTTGTFNASTPNAHWKAQWVETVTNWGVTEGGSSGSPLFKGSNKFVVGTLSGGLSYCDAPTASANDLYGKFSEHWISNGTSDADRLKPWLDPDDTGDMTCPGYDPTATGSAPVADFSGTPTTVVVGGSVTYTDLSTNNPTSWSWTFAGGTPATSTAQNPVIVYNTAGTYNVVLVATNGTGNDTETKTGYITVVAADDVVAAFSATPTTVAQGGTVNFTDESIGDITSWSWQFQGVTPSTSSVPNPSITYPTAGVYNVTLTVSDGTNSDDEIKTGYITVTGPAGTLTASFVASDYSIVAGECINFNDQTDGNPTSWSWSFPGATPSTSTNQHPTNICYATPGVYDVVLQATNASDQDTYICEDCITVNPDPSQPIANFEANITTIPVGGVVHFTNTSENGPFNQWSWEFEGGTPATFSDSAPPPIAYLEVGVYNVTLRCRKTNNVQDIETKTNYIHVIPEATVPPVANFTANYTVIQPGESINFIDLSSGGPYQWTWEFEGADVGETSSNQQNPVGITYSIAGVYSVTLTVSNNFGIDEMEKLLYITVAEEVPCTSPPTVAFDAISRLIPAGGSVQYFDLSTGNPTYHTWSFSGGIPSSSNEGSPTNPIVYNNPGIYDVRLTVSNDCGSSSILKENYVYVFSSPVQSYCDTLTTIDPNEVVEPRVPSGTWGFLAGQNGENIKAYANYFNEHAFSQINAIIVPVKYSVYGSYSSYVTFYVWDGQFPTPDTILGSKKVYLRDLIANQSNVVTFDNPVEIEGPFYLGYKINYPDENNDGFSDDSFVIGIAAPRVNDPEYNQMWVQKSGVWHTTNSYFNFSSALPLSPIACLVDVEQLIAENSFDIYPNPTNGLVTIKVSDDYYNNFSLEIYDALGRKVISEISYDGMNEYTTDLSSYPEGLYIIRINTGNLSISKKLLLTK